MLKLSMLVPKNLNAIKIKSNVSFVSAIIWVSLAAIKIHAMAAMCVGMVVTDSNGNSGIKMIGAFSAKFLRHQII